MGKKRKGHCEGQQDSISSEKNGVPKQSRDDVSVTDNDGDDFHSHEIAAGRLGA